MSITNKFSSIIPDNCTMPLDIRYTNFLKALSDIHDEGMRDRCYKYWTSLYRYFDRSMTNERALILEEKRSHETLDRLDIEMTSRQAEIAYQVRTILQQGHQVLSNLHLKYQRKKNNLKEIEENIDDIENKILDQKSEHSLMSDLNTTFSSTSVQQITNIIDDLKLEIKNLQITRETFQTELNIKRIDYFSTHIKAYHIQQNIYKAAREFIEIQHKLTGNLRAMDEQSNQLIQLRLCKQNIYISIDQEHLNIDYQTIKEQIDNEQKSSFKFQELNDDLSYQLILSKTNENKQTELNVNRRDLLEKIHTIEEQIKKEKAMKPELLRNLFQLKIELKRKQKILSSHHRQENKLKNQIIELEHKRDLYLSQSSISKSEIFNQPNDSIQNTIHQQVDHRLKLTITHHNLKQQINTLEHTTQQYALLVKDQRQKVINYERLHDKWILDINMHRNHLLKLFNRINIMEQYINNTRQFLDHFDHINLSLGPNILIIYNQMNLFLQQRREKNDANTNINITDEDRNSLNIKFYQMRKIFQSNQIVLNQIKQNISLVNKNHSILLNQISTINKRKFPLIHHLNSLQNKSLIEHQQLFDIRNKFNHMKQSIDLDNQKFQRFRLEKQTIISLLLRKQHLIILVQKHIQMNRKNLIKYHVCSNQSRNKIQQIRNQVVRNIEETKSFQRQHLIDLKQSILFARKELLQYRKKNKDFQDQINRRHMTRQILTKFDNKSIGKENNENYRIELQQKVSSIIYRLICKTHYNIILHKRLDLLMHNILLLNSIDQQPLKDFSRFHRNYSLNSSHLNNQLKSSLAELSVLRNEIFLYKQLYNNIKYSLEDY